MTALDPFFMVTISPAAGGADVQIDGKASGLVRSGGLLVPSDQSARIITLSYDDTEGKAEKLDLTINNWTLTEFDSPLWKNGSIVRAAWGYPGNLSPLREYVVQKRTGFQILTVECLGRAILMHKERKTRSWDGLRRSDVARLIAVEYGYDDAHTFIEDSGFVVEHVAQARMTDAQLLRDLAQREGKEFSVDYRGLHWKAKDLAQPPARSFTFYTDRGRGDVISLNIKNDIYAKKTGGVKLAAIDPLTQKPIAVTADNASQKDAPALAPLKELFTGISSRDGTDLSTQERVIGSSTSAPTTETTPAAAQAQAASTYAKAQITTVEVDMEARGDPQLASKQVVHLTVPGCASLSGRYYVKGVKGSLGKGYTMTVDLKTDGKGAGGGVRAKGPVDPTKPLSPTDPTSIFHTEGSSLETIDHRDGTSSFAESSGAGPRADLVTTEDAQRFFAPD